jgi:endonuclease/exonuclease/phosphatase family metal-dependent hydrolase
LGESGTTRRRRVYRSAMGEKLKKTSSVLTGLVATLVTGVLSVSAQPSASAVTAPRTPPPASFTVSSFNVLGSSHTPPGGKRAVGTTRIVWANQLLTRHHVDVVGFQELQRDQATKFLEINAGKWALYPGLTAVKRNSENSVGWRTDKFDLVQATTVNIPYFNGNPRAMPVVLLRHKATGALGYFMNYHNPADTSTYRNQGYWRSEATRVEIALSNQLTPLGIPRFVTGDMNERAPYFCRVTKETPLKAARGGYWKNGVCYAEKPRAVDWIFGSQRLTFSNYLEDRGALAAKTSDHPVVVSDVQITPQGFPNAYRATPAAVVPKLTY